MSQWSRHMTLLYVDDIYLRKVRERATTIVPWENCPKKESTYPKREIDIDRLQKIVDRLQIVSYRLQSLLREYKKSDIGYKAY